MIGSPNRLLFAPLALAAAFVASAVPTAFAQSPAPKAQPTFTKDVAPILQRSCQVCHRPGSIGPMSLLTYEDARPWARAIKTRVSTRQMPPWHVDKSIGIRKFKDDPSLSDAELATIVSWVDSGAPRGNSADMPPARVFDDSDRWHIGKPDLIVSLPIENTISPQSSDWWADFVADSGLTEDRYIKAVEAKPSAGGGARVVHHAVMSLVDPDSNNPMGGVLNEYAVGKNGDEYPDGAGRLMKAGSKVRFNMHYHSVGETIKDRTSVGLVFYPKGYVPKHQMVTVLAPNQDDLDIPAGADNVRSDAYFKVDKNARLTSFMPHMHNRGKRQCVEAIYPNMIVEQFNCVNYDFQWQIVYNYADDVAPLLPAGTIVHVTSWHDNSAGNRNNPDVRNWVGFGNRTTDDMARHWLTFYYMSDEEFQVEVTERTTKRGTAQQQ